MSAAAVGELLSLVVVNLSILTSPVLRLPNLMSRMASVTIGEGSNLFCWNTASENGEDLHCFDSRGYI